MYRNKSLLTAAVLLALLALWMLSGLLKTDAAQSTTADTPALSALMTVQVTLAEPEPVQEELVLHGQLEPARRLDMQSDNAGDVLEVHIRKGQRVAKDQLLIALDTGNLDSDLIEARARLTAARSEQKAAKALNSRGLQSQSQLESAQANLAGAVAQLRRIEQEIVDAKITAPFAGVVNDIHVELGQHLAEGAPVLELVDDSTLIATANIAQQQLTLVQPDQAVTARLLSGETLAGQITFIAAIADVQTRSFEVEATLENPAQAIAAGVSASLVIPHEPVDAIYISPSMISLGDNEQLGVKIVDTNDAVAFVPIELVLADSQGAWVSGIEAQTRVITQGQGFVNVGDRVKTALKQESPAAKP